MGNASTTLQRGSRKPVKRMTFLLAVSVNCNKFVYDCLQQYSPSVAMMEIHHTRKIKHAKWAEELSRNPCQKQVLDSGAVLPLHQLVRLTKKDRN